MIVNDESNQSTASHSVDSHFAESMTLPFLPPGRTVLLPGRGEAFVRHHVHPDPSRPTVLLLHGWTASGDLQFFTAYEALAAEYSFVAVDHRGHGRGLRSPAHFTLEDAADDAAAVVSALGIRDVITVGYSMGGPVSLLLARRHPHLVRGMVVQATALEWRAHVTERLQWKTVHALGFLLRSRAFPRIMRRGIRRLLGPQHPLTSYVPWLSSELRRNDAFQIVQAGLALSRYDARPFAARLGVPAASLVTTRDRLVKQRKQWALADALGAHVATLADDHFCTWTSPVEYSALTLQLVRHVERGVAQSAV